MSAVSTARSPSAPKRSATRKVCLICTTGRLAGMSRSFASSTVGVRMSRRSSTWLTSCPMAENRSTRHLSACYPSCGNSISVPPVIASGPHARLLVTGCDGLPIRMK
jgi:hypothetical protein